MNKSSSKFLIAAFLTTFAGAPFTASASETTSVTLNITRPKHAFSSVEGWTIFMDGKQVAKVYNDEVKQVKVDGVSIGTHKFMLCYDILNLGSAEFAESLRPKGDDMTRTIEVQKDAVLTVRTEMKDDKDTDNILTSCNVYFSISADKLPEPMGIVFDPILEERELDSEILETPDGLEQEYEISHALERTVNFSEKTTLELAGKLDFQYVKAEVTKKWEQETNQSIKHTETVRRNLKINGTKTPKVKVVWIGTFRKGTASLTADGTRRYLPFSIQVGLKPTLKVIRD